MRRVYIAVIAAALAAGCSGAREEASSASKENAAIVVPPITASAPVQGPIEVVPPPFPSCAEAKEWNADPEIEFKATADEVIRLDAAQMECYDSLSFEINGSGPVGFNIRYVEEVKRDGSGEPVPVKGGATLRVVIFAPSADPPPRSFGWSSLQEVRPAGMLKGQATFAVGVKGKQPFAVATWTKATTRLTYVILSIARG